MLYWTLGNISKEDNLFVRDFFLQRSFLFKVIPLQNTIFDDEGIELDIPPACERWGAVAPIPVLLLLFLYSFPHLCNNF
jgi:hypothetical protein